IFFINGALLACNCQNIRSHFLYYTLFCRRKQTFVCSLTQIFAARRDGSAGCACAPQGAKTCKNIRSLLVFGSVLLYHIVSKWLKYCKTSQGGFSMTIKTDLGYIEITSEVMAGIAGYAASSCFGVK